MGWGNGMAIGWPMTSTGKITLRSGWFEVVSICNFGELTNTHTYYVENVDWVEGKYVYSPKAGQRVLLGQFYDLEPIGQQIDVIGPAYNSCGI